MKGRSTGERARFRFVDIWADDDPAVELLRTGLALEPTPEPVQEPPRAEPEPSQLPDTAEDPREAVSGLLARLRAGDLSVRDLLRRLIDA